MPIINEMLMLLLILLCSTGITLNIPEYKIGAVSRPYGLR
jgi:hypothetical protein